MCCHSGPKWKREEVPDHKFDFIDTRDYLDHGFIMRVKYAVLYGALIIAFLVYMSDIFTAVTMLTTKAWSNQILNDCQTKSIKGCIAIPFETGRWLFVGCIIFSFLLLGYETYKARKVIRSRDISYAFTNVMANNYYSIRSYAHFCFFSHISNSTKTSDDFAFFVFFVFKSWKRVLLADGPRQAINALTLYAIILSKKKPDGKWYDIEMYFSDNTTSASLLTVTTLFTVIVFSINLLMLIGASLCYVPLLCHIRGNLKEYCCHKVDKRISSLIKRKKKQRLAESAKHAQKEAMGDYSHLKNKKGELTSKPLPQPTLPNLSVDDDNDTASIMTRGPPPSTFTYQTSADPYYQNPEKQFDYPPPMPAYNPYSHHQGSGSQGHFNPSQTSVGYEEPSYFARYEDDNESTAHLTGAAAPYGHQSQYSVDRYAQHDNYPGRTMTPATPSHPTYDAYNTPAYAAYPDYASRSPAPSYRGPPGNYPDGKSGGGSHAM